MSSGWSSIFLWSFVFLTVSATTQLQVLHVLEGDPFNISCHYPIQSYWSMFPQLVDTAGEGDCTEPQIQTTLFTCFIYSAKLQDNGTYTVQRLQLQNQLHTVCVVDIVVTSIHQGTLPRLIFNSLTWSIISSIICISDL